MGEANRCDMVVSLLEFITVDMLDVRIGNVNHLGKSESLDYSCTAPPIAFSDLESD